MDDFEQLDHYDILGVSRDASADAIKRAYRQQMSRYHPDRFAGASAAEQEYAGRRSQRINEAYRVLSDFAERSAYSRGLGSAGRAGAAGPRPAAPPPPSTPRDHQAELYEQAREHLAFGRYVQAAATLRELQRLNPFYRDSATLLAQAEAGSRPAARPAPPAGAPAAPPDRGRRTLLIGGLGALALIGAGAVGLAVRRPSGGTAGAPSPSPAAAAGGAGLSAPAAPSPSLAPATAIPATAAPTEAPSATAAPTEAPSATPAPSDTPAPPTETPVPPSPTAELIAEEGGLVYAEDFAGARSWPQLADAGWSVGYVAGGYQITAEPGYGNIWAYRTSPAGESYQIAVDVEVSGGAAGLMLRFAEAGRYLAFMVEPAAGRFRLEDRTGRAADILVDEASPALLPAGPNRLLARLDGERVELRLNGQRVADLAVAAPPPTDRYGLVAVAGAGTATARFANLAIRNLQ